MSIIQPYKIQIYSNKTILIDNCEILLTFYYVLNSFINTKYIHTNKFQIIESFTND